MTEEQVYDKNDKSVFMGLILKVVRKKWPSVDNIGTADLHRLIDHLDSGDDLPDDQLNVNIPQHLIILDTRPEEEFSVSHLKSSRRVSPEATDVKDTLASIREMQGEVTVVCYCSMGYRSTLYAHTINKELEKDQQLQSRTSVFNLEGSIFKWANEGRPMVNNHGQPTKYAHPYNFMWGRALAKDLRKTTPETS